ncbi:MAG: DMT family transporter [Proteobacteria bacterium]|nr:DMT family transporter [Pseudomonadota bacterium]HQR03291.1 DMT family transporter [Rhodocyclaceae bacterium]
MIENHPMRGLALMSASLMVFSTLDAATKHLSALYPIPFIIWARYTVHCLAMLAVLGPSMGGRLFATRRFGLVLVRSLCLLATTGCGVTAFQTMPLAETTAIIFIAPVMVALMAGPMLGERVGWPHWVAMGLGFGGTLLIAHPGGSVSPIGVMLSIGAAIFFSFYQILTRRLSMTENSWAMVFHSALAGSLIMGVFMPVYWPENLPPWQDLLMISAIGAFAATAHSIQTRAFRYAPASLLAPMGYSQLIWATLMGWLIFDHLPDGYALAGIALIILGGLGVIRAERRKTASPA